MDAVKNDIRAHLRKVTEASAKQLAKSTGHSETEIANALNSMRVYAEVECEQGGRGKGMIYWLTNAAAGDDKVCCSAAKVMGVTAVEVTGELRTKLDNAEARIRELEAERDELKRDRNAHRDDVLKWERTMMQVIGEDGIGSVTEAINGLRADIDAKAKRIEHLEAEATYREDVIADYKQKFDHATEQLEAAKALLIDSEEAIDVKDAAKGYLVCAPKRKPAKFIKPENAVAKAKAAAKATGRSEVFALVPVGTAVEKKVKTVEYKEARAA